MKKIAFISIIILSIFLRFWQLGSIPISPDWDEAALGYNAYSILKTGRDEYGTFLPRTLRSFDDYKPPLYTYLAVLPIAMFGLNTWSVRLPSAIMGVLAVIGTYYLVEELYRKRKTHVSLLSSLFLAISPWHLQFSRIAFEANSGLTLNIWGLVAFFKGLSSVSWMAFSAFLFGLSLYAYHSERVFVPLLLLVVASVWKKELFADKKKVLIGILIGLITVAPLIPVILDKTSVIRLKGTSSLSDQTGLLMRSVAKLKDDQVIHNRYGVVFDNRRIVYAKTLLDGYISHFSFRWLFFTGDNDRHHAPDNALMYLWEMPFLLWGIYLVWRGGGKIGILFLSWLFIAPIAASPTNETPHAIRTLVFLPVLQMLTAIGVSEGIAHIKSYVSDVSRYIRLIGFGVLGGICVFAVANIIFYFHMYYGHLNHEYAKFWQYGYQRAVAYKQGHKQKYTKIVVSTSLEQPHMFFLFYTKYDPKKYLLDGGTSSGGFAEVKNKFDIYEFRPIKVWNTEVHDGSILYIGSPMEVPVGSVISYPDGTDAMHISE